jgi:hypothetical protein
MYAGGVKEMNENTRFDKKPAQKKNIDVLRAFMPVLYSGYLTPIDKTRVIPSRIKLPPVSSILCILMPKL